MDYNEYLSDDEIISEENENKNIIYDNNGMPIYQEDEEDEEEYNEMRRIVNNKQFTENMDDKLFVSKIEKKPKKIKELINKSLSLYDLNIMIDKKIENLKPIKFVSKRSLEKRDNSNSFINAEKLCDKKRCFNPRLPPYYLSDRYNNKKNTKIVVINDINFPSMI